MDLEVVRLRDLALEAVGHIDIAVHQVVVLVGAEEERTHEATAVRIADMLVDLGDTSAGLLAVNVVGMDTALGHILDGRKLLVAGQENRYHLLDGAGIRDMFHLVLESANLMVACVARPEHKEKSMCLAVRFLTVVD